MGQVGLVDIVIRNYGFPLSSVTRPVSILIAKRQKDLVGLSPIELSIKSGLKRYGLVEKLSFLSSEPLIWPFARLQRLFYAKDLGDSYIAIGRKV
jgi:hypothetical protein